MAIRPDYTAGTITLTSGSASFTTTGAALQSASIQQGDTIYLPAKGMVLTIDSITGQNAGTLTGNCPADAAGADQAYAIRFQPDGSRLSGKTQALIDLLSAGGFFQYDASGPLSDRDQYDARPQGFSFLDTTTDPMNLYIKGSDTSGDWDGPVAYAKGEKGDKGDTGDQGEQGEAGETGPSNSLSIGTVEDGETAAATITGTAPSQTLNLTLPKGEKGDQGEQGIQGPPGQDGTGSGIVQTIVAGDNVTIDDTDPANPIIASTGLSGADKTKLDGIEAGAEVNLSVGTTAGTVAAGDDARITGAAQAANNLSDLDDAGAARVNIDGLTATATRTTLAALSDSAAYLKESGFQGYFEQVDATTTDNAALIAADTVGGEIKVSSGNPNLAYLRQRQYGDLFKTSEFGGDLSIAVGLANLRHGKATVEVNELGTKVMSKGLLIPDGIELIGLGADRQSLRFDNSIVSADLYSASGIGVNNAGLLIGGGALTPISVSFDAISAGALSIQFAAAHGLKPGDVINILRTPASNWGRWDADTSTWISYPNRAYYRAGQFARVVSVEDDLIWLDRAAIVQYEPTGQYATTISKVVQNSGRFGGFAIDFTGCVVDQTNPLIFHRLNSAVVEDIEQIGATYGGITFQQCFDMTPRRLRSETFVRAGFAGAPPTSEGNDYALLISNCTRVKVKESTGVGNWAGSDIGGDNTDGAVVNAWCGYEDCTITAKHYNLAAGHHGNSYKSGYHRCTITNGAALAGEDAYLTDCDVSQDDSAPDMVFAINAAELRGGSYRLDRMTLKTAKNFGAGGRCAINLNFGNAYDANLVKEAFFIGRNMELDAPNETRPVGVAVSQSRFPVSVDLHFSKLKVASTALFVLGATADAGAPQATVFSCDCPRPAAGVPFGYISGSYTAERMKFPGQSVDVEHTLAGGSAINNAPPVNWRNPYPSGYVPDVVYNAPTSNGSCIAVNSYSGYPTNTAVRTQAIPVGGSWPASGTYTLKAIAL